MGILISNLLELLSKEYLTCVEDVCNLMLKGLGLNSKEDLINYRMKHGKGHFYLFGKNEYCFHGRGCRFENEKLKIDWDFGYDNLWCGLDPWKLFYYIKDNIHTNEFRDGRQIGEVFDNWVASKMMVRVAGLYYFR